jgi:hypothetical protein
MPWIMGIFTQCRGALGSILNKYLVPALTLRLGPPRSTESRGRTQVFFDRPPDETAAIYAFQSPANIPTSRAAATNACRATGECASPRITRRQAAMAALRLAVSRGNAVSRISAATLTSTTIRSLPPVRMVTGRSKRRAFVPVVLMLFPSPTSAQHGSRPAASPRSICLGTIGHMVLAEQSDGFGARWKDHRSGRRLVALGLLGRFSPLQEYKSSFFTASVQDQGKLDPTLPTRFPGVLLKFKSKILSVF